jgi:23S rRNA-/tRNA-specific pseudouridylate synthase
MWTYSSTKYYATHTQNTLIKSQLAREVPISKMNHVVVGRQNLLSHEIQLHGVNESDVAYMMNIGGIYYKSKDSCRKAQRILQDIMVEQGDYIRYHSNPRRYNVDIIDWKSRIKFVNDVCFIIDKPPGIPSNPTVDNLYENVIESFRNYVKADCLYLAHRLDTDTSGLLLLGRTKQYVGYLGNLFRYRLITKTYKALLMCCENLSLTNPSKPNVHPMEVLRNKQGQVIQHFTLPSSISPRYFSSQQFEGSIDCLSRIIYVSNIVTKSKKEWNVWLEDLKLNDVNDEESSYFIEGFQSWLNDCPGDEGNKDNDTLFISFCEVQLELQTGRTHQCRGQMQAMGGGLHIAGDRLYPGINDEVTKSPRLEENRANTDEDNEDNEDNDASSYRGANLMDSHYCPSPYLALQACKVEFLDDCKYSSAEKSSRKTNSRSKSGRKAFRKAKQRLALLESVEERNHTDVTDGDDACELREKEMHSNDRESRSAEETTEVSVEIPQAWWSRLSLYLQTSLTPA